MRNLRSRFRKSSGLTGLLGVLRVMVIAFVAVTMALSVRIASPVPGSGDLQQSVAVTANQTSPISPSCTASCYPVNASSGSSTQYNGTSPPFGNYAAAASAVRDNGIHPAFSGGLSGLYQIGTLYWGSNPTYHAAIVWTSIWVPSSGTNSGDQFALMLNVFDNDNYYDQIGLASDYGCPSGCGNPSNTWSVAYEQGTYGTYNGVTCCGCTGTHSRDAYDSGGLTPNSWYTFEMLLSDGYLYYYLWEGKDSFSTQLWGTSVSDSASYFLIQNQDTTCNGGGAGTGAASMNLYEEVEYVHGNLNFPQWNFRFFNTSFYQSPSGPTVMIPNSYWEGNATAGFNVPASLQRYFTSFDQGQYQVEIINEPYRLSFPTDTCSVAPANYCGSVGYLEPAGEYAPTDYCVFWGCTIASSTCGGPSGWTTSCSLSSPVPTYIQYDSAAWQVYVPSGTSPGVYYGGISVTVSNSTTSDYDNWIFYITVT
jgi:hypothetical protein